MGTPKYKKPFQNAKLPDCVTINGPRIRIRTGKSCQPRRCVCCSLSLSLALPSSLSFAVAVALVRVCCGMGASAIGAALCEVFDTGCQLDAALEKYSAQWSLPAARRKCRCVCACVCVRAWLPFGKCARLLRESESKSKSWRERESVYNKNIIFNLFLNRTHLFHWGAHTRRSPRRIRSILGQTAAGCRLAVGWLSAVVGDAGGGIVTSSTAAAM